MLDIFYLLDIVRSIRYANVNIVLRDGRKFAIEGEIMASPDFFNMARDSGAYVNVFECDEFTCRGWVRVEGEL